MRRIVVADVRVLSQADGSADALSLVNELRERQRDLSVFDERVTDFVAELSRRLRTDPTCATIPALLALAFWIRPANITRLAEAWADGRAAEPDVVAVPQGVVFHIPPSNVDTLFVYSWVLSALAGNANVVRLSPDASDNASALLAVVDSVLTQHPAIAATTAFVSYDRDERVTAELSSADMRVIWGGDETVGAIRAIHRAPYTSELAFPDRYSLALLRTEAVGELDEGGMSDLAHRFYNDAYWFDQLGCSSPRLIGWVGPGPVEDVQRRFRRALTAEVERHGTVVPTSAALAKVVHAADAAATGAVSRVDWSVNQVTTAQVDDLALLRRDSPGGGLFYEVVLPEAADIVDFVVRKDQTLTHFGFDRAILGSLVQSLGSRGIDRVVPVGDALTFGRWWDGVDLLAAFTRSVPVVA